MLGFDIAEDSPLAGRAMSDLKESSQAGAFLVLYITRGDDVIVPRGQDRIQAGDNIHMLVSVDTIKNVLPLIHRQPTKVNHVIITGASLMGQHLAETVAGKVEKVFLIEPDAELAAEAADRLKKVTTLMGDETDLDVLEEAALDRCDLFCAVSNDDQRNMMAALLAKKHSRTKAAVVVNQPEYVPVMDSLGIEIVVNPRLVTVGEILMYVRRGHVHSVTRLAERRAELIEMLAGEDSPAIKRKLSELNIPSNALVGAVIREGVLQIPTGDTQIQAGDTVVVFALPDAISKIEKLFTRRTWF
jgi:trk system potassium uptake protein TrkA